MTAAALVAPALTVASFGVCACAAAALHSKATAIRKYGRFIINLRRKEESLVALETGSTSSETTARTGRGHKERRPRAHDPEVSTAAFVYFCVALARGFAVE
jgi:VIT1/CCC1 family predicted Fe2+/Mn2+ transporter